MRYLNSSSIFLLHHSFLTFVCTTQCNILKASEQKIALNYAYLYDYVWRLLLQAVCPTVECRYLEQLDTFCLCGQTSFCRSHFIPSLPSIFTSDRVQRTELFKWDTFLLCSSLVRVAMYRKCFSKSCRGLNVPVAPLLPSARADDRTTYRTRQTCLTLWWRTRRMCW